MHCKVGYLAKINIEEPWKLEQKVGNSVFNLKPLMLLYIQTV